MNKKTPIFLTATLFSLISNIAHAEELAALTGAVNWLTTTLVSIAITVLGMQIIYALWQVNQGQKEWREVAKPILITAVIVSVPMIVTALRSAWR